MDIQAVLPRWVHTPQFLHPVLALQGPEGTAGRGCWLLPTAWPSFSLPCPWPSLLLEEQIRQIQQHSVCSAHTEQCPPYLLSRGAPGPAGSPGCHRGSGRETCLQFHSEFVR